MQNLQLEKFLPYRLNRAAAAASLQLSKIYKRKFGLTVPEWRTLATLAEFGEMTATQVGSHSAMHKTKVSRAVTSLDDRRWLKRRPDDNDGRSETLELTAQGVHAYKKLEPEMLGFETALLAGLTAPEREDLLRGMAVLEKALGFHPHA